MPLIELASGSALDDFLSLHSCSGCVVVYSAHWCGPCKQSKPALQQLVDSLKCVGIVYEDVLGNEIHKYQIRAFPTYVLFKELHEVKRVEGVNLSAVQDLINECNIFISTPGETLGGRASVNPSNARAARLARLGCDLTTEAKPPENRAARLARLGCDLTTEAKPPEKEEKSGMESNETETNNQNLVVNTQTETGNDSESSPASNLSAETIKTLTNVMGFSLIRAQKGLLFGNGDSVESAIDWIMNHQDDEDIDEPLSNQCDVNELIERKNAAPLTEEQKAAKILEIKDLLKAKRVERESKEKDEEIDREKQRRFMGQEMTKTRDQLEMEQRKRDAILRRKEKEDAKRERKRIRSELAKDKAERAANKGKMHSRLGVDGYNPDGIQYEVNSSVDANKTGIVLDKPKKIHASVSNIDQYIAKVSSYRAGGDGGKCLKILNIYVGNVLDNPEEDKYKTIKMDNSAFKSKVKPFLGAKSLLQAIGFSPNESGDALILQSDVNVNLLKETKDKLEAAIVQYG